MEKNNLVQSVTFLVATVIGFLLSINVTYFKYSIYKAKSQGDIQFFGKDVCREVWEYMNVY